MIFIVKDFCGLVATQYHEVFVCTSRLKWNIVERKKGMIVDIVVIWMCTWNVHETSPDNIFTNKK